MEKYMNKKIVDRLTNIEHFKTLDLFDISVYGASNILILLEWIYLNYYL